MSNTPRTTAILRAYKWGVNDQETFDKVAAIETELAAANARLAEIENTANLPDEPMDRLYTAESYIPLTCREYAESLIRTHALHLASAIASRDARIKELESALRLGIDCVTASTEYRIGNPAFEAFPKNALAAMNEGE